MRIAIAGTGKVATCFALSLREVGHKITHIISRSTVGATSLAGRVECDAVTYQSLPSYLDVDCVLLAVPDDHIIGVAKTLSTCVSTNCLMVHHAGSGAVLDGLEQLSAVIWPIYSIQSGTTFTDTAIPLVVDGVDDKSISLAETLANSISDLVRRGDLTQRRRLHLAATMSNNFVSHILNRVFAHLSTYDIDPLLLAPLVLDGVKARLTHNGDGTLTGPASRDDQSTIQTHMDLLEDDSSLQQLYAAVTDDILKLVKGRRDENFRRDQ